MLLVAGTGETLATQSCSSGTLQDNYEDAV